MIQYNNVFNVCIWYASFQSDAVVISISVISLGLSQKLKRCATFSRGSITTVIQRRWNYKLMEASRNSSTFKCTVWVITLVTNVAAFSHTWAQCWSFFSSTQKPLLDQAALTKCVLDQRLHDYVTTILIIVFHLLCPLCCMLCCDLLRRSVEALRKLGTLSLILASATNALYIH